MDVKIHQNHKNITLTPNIYTTLGVSLKFWPKKHPPSSHMEKQGGVMFYDLVPYLIYKVCKNLRNEKHPSYMKYTTSPLPHFEKGLTQRN
jgi:hypothetical protein